MFSVVDLPQPDGPSSTTNSLSRDVEVRGRRSATKPLGYFLPTDSNWMLAMCVFLWACPSL